MPIMRYFVFVGALLLALLFAADRYLPAPVERKGPSDPDRTIIRIASARSLPEKIVFDPRPCPEVLGGCIAAYGRVNFVEFSAQHSISAVG